MKKDKPLYTFKDLWRMTDFPYKLILLIVCPIAAIWIRKWN
jgi:hypothetical protein